MKISVGDDAKDRTEKHNTWKHKRRIRNFHMKDEEIAKMHGITRENVRIRSRAKQKLIERLEGES